jgi:uncharacterized protein (TIGR02217 family)
VVDIFPAGGLGGLGWSTFKQPAFSTRIQRSVSGRELRVADQPYPIWTWTLTYNFLRDKNDGRGNIGTGYDELRTLMGFFLRQQGALTFFYYDDLTDNHVTQQVLGSGDGVSQFYPIVRTFGPFNEPVVPNLSREMNVYADGIKHNPSEWVIPNLDVAYPQIYFTTPPAAGVVVMADFWYYFRVRFADDSNDYENFMAQLWSLKQIKLQSVLAP